MYPHRVLPALGQQIRQGFPARFHATWLCKTGLRRDEDHSHANAQRPKRVCHISLLSGLLADTKPQIGLRLSVWFLTYSKITRPTPIGACVGPGRSETFWRGTISRIVGCEV